MLLFQQQMEQEKIQKELEAASSPEAPALGSGDKHASHFPSYLVENPGKEGVQYLLVDDEVVFLLGDGKVEQPQTSSEGSAQNFPASSPQPSKEKGSS